MGELLRIAGIVKESIVDGPGIRFVVFAQGCKHNCPGCHNPGTHSFDGGVLTSIDTLLESVQKNPLLDGVTLSGGEPFEQAEGFSEFASRIHKLKMNVITYTGFTYEEIVKDMDKRPGWRALLDETDLLVDGRFELDKRNLMLKFRGSENQRIIDVKRTKAEKKIVLADLN